MIKPDLLYYSEAACDGKKEVVWLVWSWRKVIKTRAQEYIVVGGIAQPICGMCLSSISSPRLIDIKLIRRSSLSSSA